MSDCGTCDSERGILCLDCYSQEDDDRLPSTYAEYFTWAAGYSTRRRRQTRLGAGLVGVLAGACLFAATTDTAQRANRELAELRAKTAAANTTFQALREAQRCAESVVLSDLAEALEGARRGEHAPGCTVFTDR